MFDFCTDMKICTQNHFNINQKQRPVLKKLQPVPASNRMKSEGDVFCTGVKGVSFLVEKEINGYLKSITFKTPIEPHKALEVLANTKNEYVSYELLSHLHNQTQIKVMSEDIKRINELKGYKVHKMIGMGAYAFVFETTDGKILKITDMNHFPNNRKPDFFDLPLLKTGNKGYTFYYLEEKVSQNDLAQDELRTLVRQIKNRGYKMRDYLMHYSGLTEDENAIIKKEQFGRAKNGKVYLIDPGCAVAPPKHFFNPKTIKDKIFDILKKQKFKR